MWPMEKYKFWVRFGMTVKLRVANAAAQHAWRCGRT